MKDLLLKKLKIFPEKVEVLTRIRMGNNQSEGSNCSDTTDYPVCRKATILLIGDEYIE